jgi:hypothetical protein
MLHVWFVQERQNIVDDRAQVSEEYAQLDALEKRLAELAPGLKPADVTVAQVEVRAVLLQRLLHTQSAAFSSYGYTGLSRLH